jgi:hypothetical protein
MRAARLAQYAVYATAMSLVSSLVLVLAVKEFVAGRRSAGPSDAMMFLPMLLANVPYVVLQLVVAALTIKPLSLRKLFLVSTAFLLSTGALIALTWRCPWSVVRWLGSFVYSFAFGPLALLIPVLILAILPRRRSDRAAAGGSDAPGDAYVPEPRNVAAPQSRWRWYYWDLALAAVVLWFEIILDPWGVFGYLGGLINVPFSQEGLMLSFAVAPWTLLCPVVLLVRMLAVWPRRLHGRPRLFLAWGMAVTAFVAGFVLPFRLPILRSWEGFMAGFQQYVQRRVDVPAVQDWLATLKPGPVLPGRTHPDIDVEEEDLPPSIAGLKAWGWRMDFDEANRPMIWLTWGSGVMGGWGLVVGHKEMATPPSDFSQYGEVRQTIAPGAYVWYDVK